jgi:hypothetical protein
VPNRKLRFETRVTRDRPALFGSAPCPPVPTFSLFAGYSLHLLITAGCGLKIGDHVAGYSLHEWWNLARI